MTGYGVIGHAMLLGCPGMNVAGYPFLPCVYYYLLERTVRRSFRLFCGSMSVTCDETENIYDDGICVDKNLSNAGSRSSWMTCGRNADQEAETG